MSTSRIRTILRRAGVTDLQERWGEIIVCRWDGRGRRWGHPSCGAYGYHNSSIDVWEGARVHLTGCNLRRTLQDRQASPDALLFSLVTPADTGWNIIDELPPMPSEPA
jgi:hypothetical protein